MILPLRVRGVNISKYKINEYIILLIYFPGINNNRKKVLIYIKREVYLVDSLRVKIFINNNIILLKGIIINIIKKSIYINSYNVTIGINLY
jgi:hypothetical protein